MSGKGVHRPPPTTIPTMFNILFMACIRTNTYIYCKIHKNQTTHNNSFNVANSWFEPWKHNITLKLSLGIWFNVWVSTQRISACYFYMGQFCLREHSLTCKILCVQAELFTINYEKNVFTFRKLTNKYRKLKNIIIKKYILCYIKGVIYVLLLLCS